MSLRLALSTTLVLLTVAACSNSAPPPASEIANDTVQIAATPVTTEAVAVQLGMVFDDADPILMAGALLVHGTLSVGDRLEMMGSAGQRVDVHIDAIKDDVTTALVSNAKAPAGVFLSFTADTPGMTANDNLLVAKGGFPDFESAKAFVDEATPAEQL